MIVLLTGPTGVGKTDTSWALLKQMQPMLFLDCDWFASRVPFDWYLASDVESVYQALSHMMEFYIQQNKTNFVATLTIEMAKDFGKYHHYFLKLNEPLYKFRLRCDDQELEKRIQSRDRLLSQKQEELEAMIIHQREFDKLFPDSTEFNLMDTSDLSEAEVAAKIYKSIQKEQNKRG